MVCTQCTMRCATEQRTHPHPQDDVKRIISTNEECPHDQKDESHNHNGHHRDSCPWDVHSTHTTDNHWIFSDVYTPVDVPPARVNQRSASHCRSCTAQRVPYLRHIPGESKSWLDNSTSAQFDMQHKIGLTVLRCTGLGGTDCKSVPCVWASAHWQAHYQIRGTAPLVLATRVP